MGPPFPWGCRGLEATLDGGYDGAEIPSNLGRGPPAIQWE